MPTQLPPTGITISKPPVRSVPTKKMGGYTRGQRIVKMICSHITGGVDSLGWLSADIPDSPSVNYLIQRDGRIIEIVPPRGPAAWTNGINYQDFPKGKKPNLANPMIAELTREQISPNQWCVTIEHEARSGAEMTPAQWAATLALQTWLCYEFGIAPTPLTIVGHFEFDNIDRPYCPGWTGEQWDTLQANIRANLAGVVWGRVPTGPKPTKEEAPAAPPPPITAPRPLGFLPLGTVDSFDWEGEGVIVHRMVRYFNPEKGLYYEREWDGQTGYGEWEVVGQVGASTPLTRSEGAS